MPFCTYGEGLGPRSALRPQDLTLCFQDVMFGSALHALFLVVAAVRTTRLLRRKPRLSTVVSWIVTTKLALAAINALLMIVTMVLALTKDGLFTSTIYYALLATIAFILCMYLHLLENNRANRPSNLLCLYYLFNILTLAWRMRTLYGVGVLDYRPIVAAPYAASILVCFLLMLLEATSVQRSTTADPKEPPEKHTHIFSQLMFWWAWPILSIGRTKFLDNDDLFNLQLEHKSLYSYERLNSNILQCKRQHSKSKWLLLRALHMTYARPFWIVLLLLFLTQLLSICTPLLVEQLISYVIKYNINKKSVDFMDGVLISLGFLMVSFFSSILLNQAYYICFLYDMILRGALMKTIYHKALNIPVHNRESNSSIVNYMQVDAMALAVLFYAIPNTIIVPFQIVGFLVLLYTRLGVSAIISFGIILIALIIVMFYGKRAFLYQQQKLSYMDSRIKLIAEILKGMKTVKLYGWTPFFHDCVSNYRDQELASLKQLNVVMSIQAAISSLIPNLLAFATFALYAAISTEPLTPQKVFAGLSVLRLLISPLNALVWSFSQLVQGFAGYNRISAFLDHVEIDVKSITRGSISNFAERQNSRMSSTSTLLLTSAEHLKPQSLIQKSVQQESKATLLNDSDRARFILRIDNATFYSDSISKHPILEDINLNVRSGSLVAIIGAVGEGKSALIASILGELYKSRGNVHCDGSIAYVPQRAWILNTTVRENILFGLSYDAKRYHQVIQACLLQPDFLTFSQGDNTIMGEKGVSLSRGQKTRISCARALYSDADIYLFDDPLSAVDRHMDSHMFNYILGHESVLKHKTRILVTHDMHHLSKVNEIVLVKCGRIVEQGSYYTLMNSQSLLKTLITEYYAKQRSNQNDITKLNETKDEDNNDRDSINETRHALSEVECIRGYKLVFNEQTNHIPIEDADALAEASKCIKRKEQDEDSEKMERGSVQSTVYWTYFRYCGLWGLFFELMIMVICVGLLMVIQYWLGIWASKGTLENTWYYMGIYGGLVLLTSVLKGVAFYYFFSILAIRASRATSSGMLRNILRLPMAFFDMTPGGRILNRFSKDQDVIDSLLAPSLQQYTFCILQIIMILIPISIATPLFLTIILPLTILFWWIQRIFLTASHELQRLISVSCSPVFQQFLETVEGLSCIRAYRQSSRFISLIEQKIDFANKPLYNQIAISRWLGTQLRMIFSVVMFTSALFATVTPEAGATQIGVSITFAQDMAWLLIILVRVYCDLETNIISVERVKEYMELPTESHKETPITLPIVWPSRGQIHFHNYSTAYREDLDPVLRNININIAQGEKIGIVGRTGAGKSSLTLALFRIIEARSGSITIDDVDIAQIDHQDLRTRLTILPQDPMIFEGTIRENLDPLGQHSDDALWSSLESAHLKAYIARLSDGLEAKVDGRNSLSAGQLQLLCLARAILRKTKVLILDEATASVDHQTDELVQQTIRQEFAECTILTIAHRIDTVIDYDKILVLEKGQIVEFGTPEQLLFDFKSHFYRLAKESELVQ